MKFKFNKNYETDVVIGFDDDEEAVTELENFSEGEIVEADLLNEFDDFINIQFGDGDLCYGIPKSIITILERDEDE